jgi:hypothetical protein
MIQDFLTFAIDAITLSYITLLALEFLIDTLPPKLPKYNSVNDSEEVIKQMKPLSRMRLQSAKLATKTNILCDLKLCGLLEL